MSEQKLDLIISKLKEFEPKVLKIDGIESGLTEVRKDMTEVRKDMTEVRKDIARIDNHMKVLDLRLSLIEQRLANIEPWISVDNKHPQFDPNKAVA